MILGPGYDDRFGSRAGLINCGPPTKLSFGPSGSSGLSNLIYSQNSVKFIKWNLLIFASVLNTKFCNQLKL